MKQPSISLRSNMKHKMQRFILINLFCIFSFWHIGECSAECNMNNSENQVIADKLTYPCTQGKSWPANAISDVTLAEIHTEIDDYKLYCSAPEGYTIKLVKQPNVDDVGFYIYRIVCDMSATGAISPNNQNEIIRIPFTIKGTNSFRGKPDETSIKNRVSLQRFSAPYPNSTALLQNWYLSEYQIDDNQSTMVCKDRFTHDAKKSILKVYNLNESPLRIIYKNIDKNSPSIKTLTTSCNTNLPGWIKGNDIPLQNNLEGPYLVYPKESKDFGCAIFFLNNNKMIAIKTEYDDHGYLLKVHRYTFLAQ